jgi:hypothetical protein
MPLDLQIHNFSSEEGPDFSLTLNEVDAALYAVFDEAELQGGGYTYLGLIRALCDRHLPRQLEAFHIFDAEADNFYAHSAQREPLEQLFALITNEFADLDGMRRLIASLGDKLE